MDEMRDKVSAINQRIKALSDEFDVYFPLEEPTTRP
jgi:hypothetical protein